MKLIIDIDDAIYKQCKRGGILFIMERVAVENAIADSIPLEKIRAKILRYRDTIDRAIAEDSSKIEGMKEAYNDCLEVIDKYREGANE